MSSESVSPQGQRMLRSPQRSSSSFSDMVQGEETQFVGKKRHQLLHSSRSTGQLTSYLPEKAGCRAPQSTMARSCDPHLQPIIRRRARSLPGSPERKRSNLTPCRVPGCKTRKNHVRFADALGLELAEVKVFQAGEEPSIPLHVLSRLSINSDLCCNKLDVELTNQCLVPDFQQPGDCEDFPSRLQQQQVCLERVSSSDLGLNGTIKVTNLSFEKQVAVRYTFNHWKSQHEVSAQWQSSVDGQDGETQMDIFTFFLPMPPFLLQPSSVFEFAILYQANGQEHWDNNQDKNYTLTCRNHPLKMPKECEESWIHFV